MGGDPICPIPVPPIQAGKISPPQRPVLHNVETVAAAYIECGGGSHLHWTLGPAGLGTPHSQIYAVGGVLAGDSKGDTIEIGNRSRPEQISLGQLRTKASQNTDGPLTRIGK